MAERISEVDIQCLELGAAVADGLNEELLAVGKGPVAVAALLRNRIEKGLEASPRYADAAV